MHQTKHPTSDAADHHAHATGSESGTGFEAELRALLADAAFAHQPPAGGPAQILAAARGNGTDPEPSAATGRSTADRATALPSSWSGRRVLAGAAVLVLLVAGLSFAFGSSGGPSARTSGSGAALPTGVERQPGSTTTASFGAPTDNAGNGGASKSGTDTPATPALDPKIVKTGTVELQVAEGTVPGTFDRLTALASGNGGFVADEKTAEAAGIPNGTITLRVPAAGFETVLAQARKWGKVQSASTSGQDVTAEYTDVDARLKALTSGRDQLSLVLTSAQNVEDILAVRDRINGVQTEIEQLQGRKNVLDNQVSLSTLNVSVSEPAGDRPVPAPVGERTGFDKAWHDALHGFNSGVQTLIAGSGRTVLVLLCLGLVLLGARFAWRYTRRRVV